MEKDPLVICINGFKNFHLKFCQRFGNTNEEEKVLKNVHKYIDSKIYKKWEESGYFNPDNMIKDGLVGVDADKFSIVLPPPNVTGQLHLGHAAMLAIEDIVVRFQRMQGKKTTYLYKLL
jgi:valyl-tRNA synthetase